MPNVVGDKYAEYAGILASQGRLSLAMQYLVRATAADSLSASVLRERIFNSDVRNFYSVPQHQHPPFPFEVHDVGVAPARPVQQPLSSGSTGAPQQAYNAVADAFGDAFGAPLNVQPLAAPQQPMQVPQQPVQQMGMPMQPQAQQYNQQFAAPQQQNAYAAQMQTTYPGQLQPAQPAYQVSAASEIDAPCSPVLQAQQPGVLPQGGMQVTQKA